MPSIDYNDERFTNLTTEKNNALNQSNTTYDNLINQSNNKYEGLINQSKDWANQQAEIQNQQKDFTVEKIEQQKEQAQKDYTKEQKGAYQDYMKQSNAYGGGLQSTSQNGLAGSGWSETIQSGYYNTYQNRYAQARESYNNAVLNYNNNIKEAELQNSSMLAQIYADAQKEQLELTLQQFSVIKDLTLAKQNAYNALDSEYNNRWRQVESQINTENSLAEQIRQYNENLALQRQQVAQEQANWEKEYQLSLKSLNTKTSSSSSSLKTGSSTSSNSSTKLTSGTGNKNSNTLSQAASNLIKQINSSNKGSVVGAAGLGMQNKTSIANAINNAYKSRTISDTDVELLIDYFNIE